MPFPTVSNPATLLNRKLTLPVYDISYVIPKTQDFEIIFGRFLKCWNFG